MTHSPGPWKVGNGLEIYSPDGRVLAELRWGVPDPEVKGNLPLILAAPELLAALIEITIMYENQLKIRGFSENQIICSLPASKAHKAIAKARGEQ